MQANKAGLLEVADVFVINKADRPGVAETRRDLEQMLDLGGERAWRPPIVETTATTGEGTDGLVEAIWSHRDIVDAHRGEAARARARRELDRVLAVMLRARVALLRRRRRLRGAGRRAARRSHGPVPGGRDVTVIAVIATTVAYDLVFVVHVLAAVATVTVFIVDAQRRPGGRARRRAPRSSAPGSHVGAIGPRACCTSCP